MRIGKGVGSDVELSKSRRTTRTCLQQAGSSLHYSERLVGGEGGVESVGVAGGIGDRDLLRAGCDGGGYYG